MTVHIPVSKRRVARHTIVEVRFQQTVEQRRPVSEAPLLCSCGEVTTSGRWDAHRGPTVDQSRVARIRAAQYPEEVPA